MICKLTGKVGTPIDAHIIPKSFYLIRQENGPLCLMTNTPNRFPKRRPQGIYDNTIVTAEGEAIFAPWDEYAAGLLLRRFNEAHSLTHDDGQIVGFEYPAFDYAKLKLFFLSVLWRAGASSQDAFKSIRLGPHLETIKKHLLDSDPGTVDQYATVLATFDDDPSWAKIMNPFPERYGENGIRFYRLYVGNFIAYIKVDQRSADNPMRALQLTPNSPLRIVRRCFAESKERRVMDRIVNANGSAIKDMKCTSISRQKDHLNPETCKVRRTGIQ